MKTKILYIYLFLSLLVGQILADTQIRCDIQGSVSNIQNVKITQKVAHKKNASAKPSRYSKLSIETQGNSVVIPFCTSFPTGGHSDIVSRKMLAGTGGYLRGNRHFLYQEDKTLSQEKRGLKE